MQKYYGTEAAPKGVYLNLSTGEFAQLYGEEKVLPARKETSYIKVPALLAALAGPFIGLAFIIFLPLTGILGTIAFVGVKAGRAVTGLTTRILKPATASWQPGTAYLTPRGDAKGKQKAAPETDTEMAELEGKIKQRRMQGEK